MSKDEVIAWVKQRVDLFTMRHGTHPTFMLVNEQLYNTLGQRSHWMDTRIRHAVAEPEGYRMELWLGGQVSIEMLTHIPTRAQ